MPNTELVFSAFKPDVAKQGFAAVQSTIKIFESVPGCLSAKIGHVLRYQGRDVRTEYRGVLAIEWDHPSSFHAFYPTSPAFQSWISPLMPFFAAKATPVLYTLSPNSSSSASAFSTPITQIFTGKPAEGADEEEAARQAEELHGEWEKLVERVNKIGAEVEVWGGRGVEGVEGVGILGWRGVGELDEGVMKEGVREVVERLRGGEWVVDFRGEEVE